MGVQVGSKVAGVGGTGFTSGGYCGEYSFGERIDDVLTTSPEILIIQGGLNDLGRPSDTVRVPAAQLLETAEDVPRVVVLGPVDAPVAEGEAGVDVALSEAVRAAGREYVSGLDQDLRFLPDGLHLTQESHDELARHVAERIGLHRHERP